MGTDLDDGGKLNPVLQSEKPESQLSLLQTTEEARASRGKGRLTEEEYGPIKAEPLASDTFKGAIKQRHIGRL